MKVRVARPDETAWVNARYADVGFLPSDPARDLTLIAEVDGERAGLGRLVPSGDDAVELGGMLVFDAFRGQGVARAIIEELLQHAAGRRVYCIPFADLEPIYSRFGFERADSEALPRKIQEKLDWCAQEITRPVLLMKRITT